jgi:hypothetical protein
MSSGFHCEQKRASSISDGEKEKIAVAVFYSDRENWSERRKLMENLLGCEYSLSLPPLLWFVFLWSFKFIFWQCWRSPQGAHAQGLCHWAIHPCSAPYPSSLMVCFWELFSLFLSELLGSQCVLMIHHCCVNTVHLRKFYECFTSLLLFLLVLN